MAPNPRTGEPVLPAPTKQPVRRPTLVRKRDDTESSVDRARTPSSPSKRLKVSFDDEVQVKVMDDWEKAPAIIREEVRRALERHAQGDDSAYNRVKEIYTTKPTAEDAPSSTTLRNYTAALLSSVSGLNRSCSSLVHAVLKSVWIVRDEDYVALFLRLLGNLVSAQGVYLGDVLRMLVGHLVNGEFVIRVRSWQRTYSMSAPGRDNLILGESPTPRSQIQKRAHAALRYLLRLIPSASSVLSSILTSLFPHSSDSKRAHVAYVQNLLKVIEYAPELQADALSLITERLVKIDVQVQVDLEDLADDVGDGVVQDIPNLKSGLPQDADDEDESDDTDSSDEEIDPDAQRAKDITTNVEKLDCILDILFTYYEPQFSGTSVRARDTALDMLFSQFTTIILPTYRSRHTQFLLFHFAQTSPALVDNFVGACVHFAFDKGRPAIMRHSAAAYLASFVARGIHVPSQIVRDVFDYIGGQLTIYRAEYEPNCRGPNLRRYSNYYSLLQALLYIFCFRWRDLEAGPEEQADDDDIPLSDETAHAWIPGIKETLAQNIFSKLNPLKVCSPAIVNEFAKIANHLGIIYVFHLLETNKRLRLSQFSGLVDRDLTFGIPERETALSGRKDESYHQLDEYFPFDPYHLPRSKRWVEGDYREWKGIPGLHEDGDASGSEEEDEEDSDAEEGTGTDDETAD
ncbi:hypothetical protein MMC17_005937 [Xylographa soralifera]|nr:hypothetical protein [Xylographa soralifera]